MITGGHAIAMQFINEPHARRHPPPDTASVVRSGTSTKNNSCIGCSSCASSSRSYAGTTIGPAAANAASRTKSPSRNAGPAPAGRRDAQRVPIARGPSAAAARPRAAPRLMTHIGRATCRCGTVRARCGSRRPVFGPGEGATPEAEHPAGGTGRRGGGASPCSPSSALSPLHRNGVTGSTGLIRQTRSAGAGRLSWAA